MKETFLKIINKTRYFVVTKYFMAILLGAAGLITIFHAEVWGTFGFAVLIGILLIVSNDLIATLLPFMLLCEFVCKMYNSFDTFIKFWPMAFFIFPALIFHFFFYRDKGKKFALTPILTAIIAVSIAVSLGGLFTKGAWSSINGTGIFFIAGLGVGQILFYFYINDSYKNYEYDVKLKFAYIMMVSGIFACFMVLQHYLSNIQDINDLGKIVYFQWKNNISTFLMICMPFPFYLSSEKKRYSTFQRFWVGVLIYICLLLSPSRGGYLFGTIEFFFCLAYVIYADDDIQHRRKNISSIIVLVLFVIVISLSSPDFVHGIINAVTIRKGEARVMLAQRGFDNFLRNPIFGVGISYDGNADIWAAKKGALNWYNCSPVQIIASFGLVGVAAYLYQAYVRLKTIFSVKSAFNLCILISYLGITMMGFVNPAEFSPVPYLIITNIMMILTEHCNKTYFEKQKLPLNYNKKGFFNLKFKKK